MKVNTNPLLNRQVQAYLVLGGYDPDNALIADGDAGEQTNLAIRRFQEQYGLDATGDVNEPTVAEMYDRELAITPELIGDSRKTAQCFVILSCEKLDPSLIANGEPWGDDEAMLIVRAFADEDDADVYVDNDLFQEG